MKTDTKTKKDFDAVEMMRQIRNNIDQETEGMNFEQLKKYYKNKSEKFENEKKVSR